MAAFRKFHQLLLGKRYRKRMTSDSDARPLEINWVNTWNLVWNTLKIDHTYRQKIRVAIQGDRPGGLLRSWNRRLLNLDDAVFLIGSPRSGTTFLGDCLSILPGLSYHFEPVATKRSARYVYEQGWSFKRAKFFYRMVYSALMIFSNESSLRFCEKTPRNCLIIPFLSKAFSNSKFIYLVRDGRDCAVSHRKKPWFQSVMAGSGKLEPGGYPYGPYARFWVETDRWKEFESTSDLHRCIWCWRVYNEHSLGALASLPKHRIMTVFYEDLVNSPKSEGERILRFLEVSDQESKRLFYHTLGKAKTTSVGNWRRSLIAEELEQVFNEAGNLLAKLGYK